MGPVFRRKTFEGDQKSLLSHPPSRIIMADSLSVLECQRPGYDFFLSSYVQFTVSTLIEYNPSP